MGSIVAQDDSDSIGCRVVAGGVAGTEISLHEVNAVTFHVMTAA